MNATRVDCGFCAGDITILNDINDCIQNWYRTTICGCLNKYLQMQRAQNVTLIGADEAHHRGGLHRQPSPW